jgi:hypothetical protein
MREVADRIIAEAAGNGEAAGPSPG